MLKRGLLLSVCLIGFSLEGAVAQPSSHHGSHKAAVMNGPATIHTGQGPTVHFDLAGRLWAAWIHGQHVYVNYSDDLGKSFSPPVKVNAQPEKVRYNGEARAQVAVDSKGNVFVVWNQKLEKRFTGNVRFSRSVDGGRSFSSPLTINDNRDVIGHAFITMVLDANDKLHFTWLDARDVVAARKAGKEFQGTSLYYAYSDDHGKTISENRLLAKHTCQCCRIAADFDTQGTPVVLWRHIFDEPGGGISRDHGLIKIGDKNESLKRVSFEKWPAESCPHHGPSLSIDDDNRYHMTWFNLEQDKPGLYYGYSDDEGKTMSKVYPFANDESQAQYPYLMENGDDLYLVWKGFNGDKTSVYLKQSSDGGMHWSDAKSIASTAGESDHPLLVKYNSKVYLSWQRSDEGYLLQSVGDDQ